MSPVVHALIAWLIAIAFVENVRDRRLVVLAGVLSDLDGIQALWDLEAFQDVHHTWGHTFVFGVPLAAALAVFAKERGRVFAVALAAFGAHLFADIVGTNWPVYPLYPYWDQGYSMGEYAPLWVIYTVIGFGSFLAVALLLFVVAYRREVTPMEFFSEKWERRMMAGLVYPLKYKCDVCGKAAMASCEGCGKKVCTEHLEKDIKFLCTRCGRKQKNEQAMQSGVPNKTS